MAGGLALLVRAAAGAIALACANGSRAGETTTVSDSAGVALVHNADASDSITADIAEVRRIGAVSGPDAYRLDRVSALALDGADSLFVAEERTGSIRVFDARGRFVRRFGRRGQGHGELGSIVRLWLHADTVAVMDVRNGLRLSFFRRDGRFIESVPLEQPDGSHLTPIARVAGGWLAWVRRPAQRRRHAAGVVYEDTTRLHLLDARARSIGPPVRTGVGQRLVGMPDGDADWPLFESQAGAAVTTNGTQYVARSAYRIDVYAADGRLLRRISRAHAPMPITPADADSLRERIRRRYRERAAEPGVEPLDRVLGRVDAQEAARIETHWSAIGRVLASDDGAVWVERADLRPDRWRAEYENLWGEPDPETPLSPRASRWDRFDRNGRFRGAIDLPPGFRSMILTTDGVIGVLGDESGMQFVVRYATVERGR